MVARSRTAPIRNPEEFLVRNGWEKTMTGGGCMAWQRGNTVDDGFMMLTDTDGADLPRENGIALLGFYDKEGQSAGAYLRFPLSDLLYNRITIG